jgi:hypothetical protein
MNYRKGQCDDKRPNRDWIKAAREAINYVAKLNPPKEAKSLGSGRVAK